MVSLLEDYIHLAARLQHFPGADEAGRDHEAVAGAHGLGVAFAVAQHGNALENFAVFVFAVTHRPLADIAFPNAGIELVAGAGVVVAYLLLRVALENLFRGRAVAFGAAVTLVEINDGVDSHDCVRGQSKSQQ